MIPVLKILFVEILRAKLALANHVADKPTILVCFDIAFARLYHIDGYMMRGFCETGVPSDNRRTQLRPCYHVGLFRIIAVVTVFKLKSVRNARLSARWEIRTPQRACDLRKGVVRPLHIVRHLRSKIPVAYDRMESPCGYDRKDRKYQHGEHQLHYGESFPHRFFLHNVMTVVSLRSLLRIPRPQRITVRTVYRYPLLASSSSSISSTVRSNV